MLALGHYGTENTFVLMFFILVLGNRADGFATLFTLFNYNTLYTRALFLELLSYVELFVLFNKQTHINCVYPYGLY